MFKPLSFLRILVLTAALLPSLASANVALNVALKEVLASRAGRLIFAELYQGSLSANRIIGVTVANPTTRMERLAATLSESKMRTTSDEVAERLNRVYLEFSKKHPSRADLLFRGAVAEVELLESDRRLIQELIEREFSTRFIDQLASQSYRARRDRFLLPITSSLPRKLSPQERALVYWETQKNAVSTRSQTLIPLENYEIPLDLVSTNIARRISPELRDSLIFSRDGRKYMRWLINPEDTRHYVKVEAYLTNKGISPVRHQYFQGYQTASRSYIVMDPKSGGRVVFSVKVSTNRTGGNWQSKLQTVDDAIGVREIVEYVRKQAQRSPFRNIILMDEPAMFGIREIDQAMLVRILADLPSREVTYLPGFSALHEALGERIALANGSKNPAEFWNEHYNKPLARALAEFAAKTGLTYDSPHSQNFLIEMIGINPTGRIVLRDYGDAIVTAKIMQALGESRFLKSWEPQNVKTSEMSVYIGLLHGNSMPRWVNETTYRQYATDFFKTFESEFSAITRIPEADLSQTLERRGLYYYKEYQTRSEGWLTYLKRLSDEAAASGR